MADLAMGEHGWYVWTAYGLAAIAYAWLIGWPLYRHRRFFQQARLLQQLTPKDTQPELSQPHVSNTDSE